MKRDSQFAAEKLPVDRRMGAFVVILKSEDLPTQFCVAQSCSVHPKLQFQHCPLWTAFGVSR